MPRLRTGSPAKKREMPARKNGRLLSNAKLSVSPCAFVVVVFRLSVSVACRRLNAGVAWRAGFARLWRPMSICSRVEDMKEMLALVDREQRRLSTQFWRDGFWVNLRLAVKRARLSGDTHLLTIEVTVDLEQIPTHSRARFSSSLFV